MKNHVHPGANPKMDLRSIMPAPTKCRYCNSPVEYTTHDKIYGGRTFSDWPYIYLCTNDKCRASIGVHPNTNHPLGTLADHQTKEARKTAHAAFDQLWKGKHMKRGDAYKWLADQLDIERWRCHIAWFEADLCARVTMLAKTKLQGIIKCRMSAAGPKR